ncbi:radical SAM protein [Mycobacterium sp. CVI_P3]|uniref:Radical SAM protein n=1 Tax=Mycobacterium pinniadriaticum TaxID=2994102 RepID=A0ABT3SJD2_9MYCO|nr:radical SAM protein [Mycobacterium pinniadriaticum]MCX2933055.1 radical SAM protein [Mycobacterium pinniadriaticum]MCX2939477.1 radical SAM protein [Mycobacterium pinniadriaticum]
MGLRGDRLLRYVTAFCPTCHADAPERPLSDVMRLSGRLVEHDGRVWLERGCPTHGLVRTLYDEDPEILSYLEEWTAPTKAHTPDVVGNFDPIPSAYLRGLPEMQTQHTCILLEDIAEICNLRCPTCFTDSSPDLRNVVPVADVLANVDQRLARENGRLDVLMLSGGEPTLHPALPELITELVARPITRILVNSNGIRIATDDALLELLAEHRHRVEVYLQYDGLSDAAHRHHRGGDLRAVKQAALQRLSQHEIFTTLVMTTALGVNDSEIGDMVRLALDTPYVGGISIQPQFGSGRSGRIDALDRLTHTGVLKRLGPQTDGLVTWRDLTALPCSHPHCCSVGYLIRDDAGAWRSLVSLLGHDGLKSRLGLVSNRIVDTKLPQQLRLAVKESLLGLLSEQSSLSHPHIGDIWRIICQSCDLGVGTLFAVASSALPGRQRKLRRLLGERVVRITVKPFMDIDTMLEERLVQCCVHVGTSSGQHQCAPFCAVQAWPALGRQRLSVAAGRQLPLIAVDAVTRP